MPSTLRCRTGPPTVGWVVCLPILTCCVLAVSGVPIAGGPAGLAVSGDCVGAAAAVVVLVFSAMTAVCSCSASGDNSRSAHRARRPPPDRSCSTTAHCPRDLGEIPAPTAATPTDLDRPTLHGGRRRTPQGIRRRNGTGQLFAASQALCALLRRHERSDPMRAARLRGVACRHTRQCLRDRDRAVRASHANARAVARRAVTAYAEHRRAPGA